MVFLLLLRKASIMADTIHQYFKKALEEMTIFVQINPETMLGLELIVLPDGQIKKTERAFDKAIYEDLEFDEFEPGNAIEFNLYLKGFTK
jgi:hypothetical protein